MSEWRLDPDAGAVDLSAEMTGEGLPLITPGEILREEFMSPMGISTRALAQAARLN